MSVDTMDAILIVYRRNFECTGEIVHAEGKIVNPSLCLSFKSKPHFEFCKVFTNIQTVDRSSSQGLLDASPGTWYHQSWLF
jgi:hypothetical protein